MTFSIPRLVFAVALVLLTPSSTSAASLTSKYASVANFQGYEQASSSSTFGRRRASSTLLRSSTGNIGSCSSSAGILATIRTLSGRQSGRSRRQSDYVDFADDVDDIFAVTPASLSEPYRPKITYRDLSPIGKLIAGTVEVCVATVMEYVTGFTAGYVIGCVTDVPRLLFQSTQPDQQVSLMQDFSARTARMNGKSLKWARSWGELSAVFGGCRVAVKLLRNGKEDEWSSVFSSMAAGAFLARAQGPQGMIQGAATYGLMIYVLSGMAFRRGRFRFSDVSVN
ncbi:hypothetical protein MPSEU_000799300 [Mayamaea pseudoterrestris]|nr:hypothetical protein MPSEU_000799300 [Mayamaea pseudoterrestris]